MASISDLYLPAQDELVALYDSVGWAAYTVDPERLHLAVSRSLRVVCAREGEKLVGLARVVGDGLTIIYLQDILVHPDHQRRGIGAELMKEALRPFSDVRQQVLLTDAEPRQREFYEALGFKEIRDVADAQLRAFVRFN